MAAQSWYRVGTVALTNGSPNVTGTGTGWTSQARSGDMITFDAGASWYEVATVVSNTAVTLATNFTGTTGSGLSYAINRTSPLWTLASDLATRVADLLDAINTGIVSWFTVSGAPLNTLGDDGDYAVDPTAKMLYGPKAAGAWPSGVSLGGPAGADGSSAGIRFTFATSTVMADPGDGGVRLNHATLSSVTAIALDDQSAASGNPAVRPYILTWDDSTSTTKGFLTLKKVGAEQNFALYRLSSLTDNTEWVELAVTHIASNGSFSASDLLAAEFSATGDSGSVGSAPTISDATLASTLKITGDNSPAQLTADQNDYNPANLSTTIALRLSTDSNGGAGRTITGLAGGANGRVIVIHNIGSSLLTLADESGSSGAANRFALRENAVLIPDESIVLRYDGASSRWRALAQRVSEIGDIVIRPTSSPRPGTLVCDGSAVSRTTYAALFSVIGTTYGVGDASTTFNLPDYRGEFLRGWANGSANDPDRATRTNRGDGATGDVVGSKQADEFKAHTHTVPRTATGLSGGSQFTVAAGATTNTGSAGGNETRPRNVNVLYCIVFQ